MGVKEGETMGQKRDKELPVAEFQRKQHISEELERAIKAFELMEACDDPELLKTALAVLDDLLQVSPVYRRQLKTKIRWEIMSCTMKKNSSFISILAR